MRTNPLPRLLLGALVLAADPRLGAADKDDPVFADRKLSEWVADLRSDELKTRSTAQRVLPLIGPKAAPAVPELLEIAAYERLGFDSPRFATPPGMFGSSPVAQGSAFEETVQAIGADAVPALAAGLKHPFAGVREKAARALRRLGRPPRTRRRN